jgi:translation initiation factor RLI1
MRPASTEEEVSNQLQKILHSENTAFRKHCIQKTLHSENTAEKNADAYVADTPAIFADLLKLNLKVKFFAVSHGETD